MSKTLQKFTFSGVSKFASIQKFTFFLLFHLNLTDPELTFGKWKIWTWYTLWLSLTEDCRNRIHVPKWIHVIFVNRWMRTTRRSITLMTHEAIRWKKRRKKTGRHTSHWIDPSRAPPFRMRASGHMWIGDTGNVTSLNWNML